MGSVFNESPGTFAGKWWKEYVIRVLCWWGPACVDCQWRGVLDKIINWLMVMRDGLLKKEAKARRGAETWVCLNAPSQSAHEWKLSINKQARPAIMTALWGKDGERHVETSVSLHPSSPLLHCLIPLSHLRWVEIAWPLHSYNLTPNETCPQWLLAPHRLWLKPFCLGTASVYMMSAHSMQAYNGMRTVDCMGPSVQYALIARMAENIDTPRGLSFASGLEGLILTRPRWHAVLELKARQRALKWNFNELQYALPHSVIFPCDFKSGFLWMLSLKLSAVQRAQVLKTAPDLCVMARMDKKSFVSPILPYNSPLISQQDKDDGQTDTSVHFLSSLR